MNRFHLTPRSGNAKTGPIATSVTSAETCPGSCPLKGGACYAEAGFHTRLHWGKVTKGERGGALPAFLAQLAQLPAGSMFRHNVAGDLPGAGETIDQGALSQLLQGSAHLLSWTYTHKKSQLPVLRDANSRGSMVINASADTLQEADTCADAGIPTVVVVPEDFPKGQRTPKGRLIAICPAQLAEGTTCQSCGKGSPLCARRDREFVVGFRAHGIRKGEIQNV